MSSVSYHENLDVLILGDSNVGKSTLINCYLTRNFSFVPSGVLKSKIELPGTEYGCKSVNIHLCDTPTYNQWNENLEKLILSSSIILIVGSWDNPQSINRIENHWLPSLLNKFSIPIIILINKSDMLGDLDNINYMNQDYRSSLCNQLQNYNPKIKHVFQTSCIQIKSVINAFDIAIQLIIFPLHILKSNNYNNLINALKRIFHMFDRDNNALLTDDEILYYYRYCLTLNSMKAFQLERIKKYLLSKQHKRNATGNEYIINNNITFIGFVELHLILIEMLQHDMIWKSLQKFGYARKNLLIVPNIYPKIPSKTQFINYCLLHNPILRSQKHNKTNRLQYELNPNILGFLIAIFTEYCENKHDEYNESEYNNNIHEYSTCFITEYGLDTLLNNFNLNEFPFNSDDLELVGSKTKTLTLTCWLSLWSLLMHYETERALKYLLFMGAPTIFPSNSFIPKWSDYINAQIVSHLNTYQRFYNCLIVTYPNDRHLINEFIRSSVGDFSSDNDYYNNTDSIQRLNTIFLLKPKDKKSNYNNKYSYGMLNDAGKSKEIYNQHHNFLYKNQNNKRKALIQINVFDKHHGIDIYHTLFEAFEDKLLTDKQINKYDAVIYLHTQQTLRKCRRKIKNLYNICKDNKMPIITVNTMNTMNMESDNNDLEEILNIYDLPLKIIKWESFCEDQMRFNYDLIQLLHFRQLYVPKTIWQIRKMNFIHFSKKTAVYTCAAGLIYYLSPFNIISKISKKEKKEKSKTKKQKYNNQQWKILITVALVTSVFCGSYYIYDVYSKYKYKIQKHKQQQQWDIDNEDVDEDDEDAENMNGLLSYLISFFYPKFDDEDFNDDDLSLTSFGFLKRKRSDSED